MSKKIKGLTLLEILLALIIFSAALLAVYSVLRLAIRVEQQAGRSFQLSREARVIMDKMANDFENMVFYDFRNSYPARKAFTGGPNQISLVRPSEAGLKRVTYFQEQGYLIREEKPFLDSLRAAPETGEGITLTAHLAEHGLKFAYACLGDKVQPFPVWKDSWSAGFIPSGIRIELTFAGRGMIKGPSFVRDVFIPTGFWGE